MTNQEAICILNAFYRAMTPHSELANSDEHPRRIYFDSTTNNINLVLEAIDIAIKALDGEAKDE